MFWQNANCLLYITSKNQYYTWLVECFGCLLKKHNFIVKLSVPVLRTGRPLVFTTPFRDQQHLALTKTHLMKLPLQRFSNSDALSGGPTPPTSFSSAWRHFKLSSRGSSAHCRMKEVSATFVNHWLTEKNVYSFIG